jgi:hypothetical protein
MYYIMYYIIINTIHVYYIVIITTVHYLVQLNYKIR